MRLTFRAFVAAAIVAGLPACGKKPVGRQIVPFAELRPEQVEQAKKTATAVGIPGQVIDAREGPNGQLQLTVQPEPPKNLADAGTPNERWTGNDQPQYWVVDPKTGKKRRL